MMTVIFWIIVIGFVLWVIHKTEMELARREQYREDEQAARHWEVMEAHKEMVAALRGTSLDDDDDDDDDWDGWVVLKGVNRDILITKFVLEDVSESDRAYLVAGVSPSDLDLDDLVVEETDKVVRILARKEHWNN